MTFILSLLTFSAAGPAFAQEDPDPPRVDRISIVSPPSGDTFGPGEQVTVEVRLTEPVVVTGNPRLVLQIGDQRRSADLQRIRGGGRLQFQYFVRSSDRDDDGIGIPANAILLNRGSIRDSGGNDADLTHSAVADDARLKVNGQPDAVPTIVSASIRTPRQGDTFGLGEPIVATIRFSQRVEVTGAPQLTIQVGTQARQLEVHRRRRNDLQFEYVVQSSDVDSDGVSMPADALALNGGSIRNAAGNDADLTHDAVPDDPARKVNGASTVVPTVRYIIWGPLPNSHDTYAAGEAITMLVGFTHQVYVTGAPQLTLQVGSLERRADHLPALRAPEPLPGSGFHAPEDLAALSFRYVVQPSDLDDDGISVPANALTLNGGSIRAVADDTDARLSHDAVADNPRQKVDGSRGDNQAPVPSGLLIEPPARGTFRGGDTISVRLSFNENVTVTGTPRLALRIGVQTRFATLRELWHTSSMLFDYVVDESDRDDNGLSIAADALELNGGTIRDGAGNDADLDLGYLAFSDNQDLKVNGRPTPVPALPLGGVLALVVALLGGGWRRLGRQPR